MEYFRFIGGAARGGCDYERLAAFGHLDKGILLGIALGGDLGEERLLAMIKLNILYAMNHRERTFSDAEDMFAYLDEGREDNKMAYPEKLAEETVKQRFWF